MICFGWVGLCVCMCVCVCVCVCVYVCEKWKKKKCTLAPQQLFQHFGAKKQKEDVEEEIGKMDYSSQLLAKDWVISTAPRPPVAKEIAIRRVPKILPSSFQVSEIDDHVAIPCNNGPMKRCWISRISFGFLQRSSRILGSPSPLLTAIVTLEHCTRIWWFDQSPLVATVS